MLLLLKGNAPLLNFGRMDSYKSKSSLDLNVIKLSIGPLRRLPAVCSFHVAALTAVDGRCRWTSRCRWPCRWSGTASPTESCSFVQFAHSSLMVDGLLLADGLGALSVSQDEGVAPDVCAAPHLLADLLLTYFDSLSIAWLPWLRHPI